MTPNSRASPLSRLSLVLLYILYYSFFKNKQRRINVTGHCTGRSVQQKYQKDSIEKEGRRKLFL